MSLRLLVLGGSGFLGRHTVQEALARGHRVTVLDRGLRAAGLFDADDRVEHLRGDRDGDLASLARRVFDAVVDASGYNAAQVERLAMMLRGTCPEAHWVYISSISVYARFPPGQDYDESAPRLQGDVGYGANKARAEDALTVAWPRAQQAIVRPALIVGPHDPTGRFTYWPLRVARGGEVLAPGEPARRVQFMDVRDLAAWLPALCEQRRCGVFNAVAPSVPMGQLLEACRQVTGSDARFVWCDDRVLLDAGVQPWTGLPLWLPGDDPEFGGFQRASHTRAAGAGLHFRPLTETVCDTYDWARCEQTLPPKQVPVLTPEREAAILASRRASAN